MSDQQLPISDQSVPVPVFTVHVIMRQDAAQNSVHARCAALHDLTVTAGTEREALLKIVDKFKRLARECLEQQRKIPFIEPPDAPGEGEVERWIPVHL